MSGPSVFVPTEGNRMFGTPIDMNLAHPIRTPVDVNRVCPDSKSEKSCSEKSSLCSMKKLSKRHKENGVAHCKSDTDVAQYKIDICKSNFFDDTTISTASPMGMMSRSSSFALSQDSPMRFGREESPTRRVSFETDGDKSPVQKQSITEEALQHSCFEAYSEVFEHELQRDNRVVSWEEGHPLRESELLALEGQHIVPFQFQEYEPSCENRVLTEIVMEYDESDTSETVSSASEFQTEGLAELQEKRIRENFGDAYDFEFYCDP